MLKKLLNLTLAAFLAVSFSAYAEEETFVQIKVPFPDGDKILHENYQKYSSIMLRYADDKSRLRCVHIMTDTYGEQCRKKTRTGKPRYTLRIKPFLRTKPTNTNIT